VVVASPYEALGLPMEAATGAEDPVFASMKSASRIFHASRLRAYSAWDDSDVDSIWVISPPPAGMSLSVDRKASNQRPIAHH
jgi:hypothetical protein